MSIKEQWRVWRTRVLVVTAICCVCIGVKATDAPRKLPAQVANRAAQLKSLLKERHDTLIKLLNELTAQYKGGLIDFDRIARAESALLQAVLDSEDNPQTRLATLHKLLDAATQTVELTKGRVAAGMTTQADMLQASSLLLNVRIELLREEIKQQAGK